MGRWSLVTPPTTEEAISKGAGAPIVPLDGVATGMLQPPVTSRREGGATVRCYRSACRNRLGGTDPGLLILIQSGERMPAW